MKKRERSQRSCSKSLRKIGKVEFTLGSLAPAGLFLDSGIGTMELNPSPALADSTTATLACFESLLLTLTLNYCFSLLN